MAVNVRLRVVEGPEAGRVFVFPRADRLLVGRAPEAHFRFPDRDPYISRHHCLVEVCPPHLFLHDLDSTNGTYVNDTPTRGPQGTCLRAGDRIRLGTTVVQVSLALADRHLQRSTGAEYSDCDLRALTRRN